MVTLCGDLHELALPVSSEVSLWKLCYKWTNSSFRTFMHYMYVNVHVYRPQVEQDSCKQWRFPLMDGLFRRPDCGPVFTGLWCRSTTSCWQPHRFYPTIYSLVAWLRSAQPGTRMYACLTQTQQCEQNAKTSLVNHHFNFHFKQEQIAILRRIKHLWCSLDKKGLSWRTKRCWSEFLTS